MAKNNFSRLEIASKSITCILITPFVKDLDAFVKWTSELQNLLVHNNYLICKTFTDKLIMYLHQLVSIVKFEIFNDIK